MKTDNSLVQDYLAAVERETSALPPAARQELVADLAEHIEVALAERPGCTREILDEMGDPRTIAATALQELGGGAVPAAAPPAARPARRRSPAWLPIVLLTVAGIVPSLVGGKVLGFVAVVVTVLSIVIVCRARHWTVAQKWTGIALIVIIPVIARLWWNLDVVGDSDDVNQTARWTLVTATSVCVLAGAGLMWRGRDRTER